MKTYKLILFKYLADKNVCSKYAWGQGYVVGERHACKSSGKLEWKSTVLKYSKQRIHLEKSVTLSAAFVIANRTKLPTHFPSAKYKSCFASLPNIFLNITWWYTPFTNFTSVKKMFYILWNFLSNFCFHDFLGYNDSVKVGWAVWIEKTAQFRYALFLQNVTDMF